jgi:hypothetical protein
MRGLGLRPRVGMRVGPGYVGVSGCCSGRVLVLVVLVFLFVVGVVVTFGQWLVGLLR